MSFSLEMIWIWSFLINAVLICIAQPLPVLTRSGWVHAGILGTILMACLGWKGWLAVVIYLVLGSLVTRVGFARKQLDGIAESRGGRRGPENLWGSAATGTFFALLIKLGIGTEYLLLIGFAASFSAKLADTFGSEIGKRWGSNTLLITSFRPVAPGTDGAISLEGTFASAIGSLLMTIAMASLAIIPWGLTVLIVSIVGLISTLAESFLGAIAQRKFKFLSNELINSIQTSLAAFLAIYAGLIFS